jgi:hypothetical protein
MLRPQLPRSGHHVGRRLEDETNFAIPQRNDTD